MLGADTAGNAVISAAIALLAKDPPAQVRRIVANVFLKWSNDPRVEPLIPGLLGDADIEVKRVALNALTQNPAAAGPPVPLFALSSPADRAHAVDLLKDLTDAMHTLLDLQLPVAMRDFIELRILPLIERLSGLINRSSYSPLEIQTVGVELTEKSQRLADVVELVGVALLLTLQRVGFRRWPHGRLRSRPNTHI